jgi:hypothetical protein
LRNEKSNREKEQDVQQAAAVPRIHWQTMMMLLKPWRMAMTTRRAQVACSFSRRRQRKRFMSMWFGYGKNRCALFHGGG